MGLKQLIYNHRTSVHNECALLLVFILSNEEIKYQITIKE